MAKPTLTELRKQADLADADFDRVCLQHYSDGRWGGYRALDDNTAPPDVIAAMEAQRLATHAFYSARDGDRGFLGGRGA